MSNREKKIEQKTRTSTGKWLKKLSTKDLLLNDEAEMDRECQEDRRSDHE